MKQNLPTTSHSRWAYVEDGIANRFNITAYFESSNVVWVMVMYNCTWGFASRYLQQHSPLSIQIWNQHTADTEANESKRMLA